MNISKSQKIKIINQRMKSNPNLVNAIFSKIIAEEYVSDYFSLNFVNKKGYDSISKSNKHIEQKHIGAPKNNKTVKSPTISNLNSKINSWILVTFENNVIKTSDDNMCFLFPPGILNSIMSDSDRKASNGLGRYVFPVNFVFTSKKPTNKQSLLLKYLVSEQNAYEILHSFNKGNVNEKKRQNCI